MLYRESARWARESSASCKEGSLEPGGQRGRQSPQSSRVELPGADAKGDRRGVGKHLRWGLGCLSGGLEPVSVIPGKWWTPPFWALLINALTTLLAGGAFPREPLCGWSRSADVAALTTWADRSPCQRVCSDLGNFPLEPK